MEPVQIKVFGERNTGTRAVIRMIDAADGVSGAGHPGVRRRDLAPFRELGAKLSEEMTGPWRRVYREAVRDTQDDALGVVGAWKHAAPRFGQDFVDYGVQVLFMVRNPYSWALSLHRRPYHFLGPRQDDLATFLAQPWLTMGRDRVDRILPSPMSLWSAKLEAYGRFERDAKAAGVATATLRFEDLVADPAAHLSTALSGLTGTTIEAAPLEEPTKQGGLDAEARRDYYAREVWREKLTRPVVEIMNRWIDWDIASNLGYVRLSPEDFPG